MLNSDRNDCGNCLFGDLGREFGIEVIGPNWYI